MGHLVLLVLGIQDVVYHGEAAVLSWLLGFEGSVDVCKVVLLASIVLRMLVRGVVIEQGGQRCPAQ